MNNGTATARPNVGPTDQGEIATQSTAGVAHLLNTKQAAKVLGVSERTVWTLANGRRLASIRFGRSVRFDPADIVRFIESSRERGGEKELRLEEHRSRGAGVDYEAGHG